MSDNIKELKLVNKGDLPIVKYDIKSWTESTIPYNQRWDSMAYGDGKFVAISYSSKIYAYSTDGINWIESTLPFEYYSVVAYGNGKFVVLSSGYTKSAAYSTDGINWTESTNPTSTSNPSIAYGNGKFVTKGEGIAYLYSINGIDWIQSTLPSIQKWQDIAYGNDKFVTIVLDSNVYAYSINGIDWIQSTLPSVQKWQAITHGNDKFVAIVQDSNVYAYSVDGITWFQSTLPSARTWSSITYGNGIFIVIAQDSNVYAYSTDGINWTQATLPRYGYWKRAVAYGDGKFVIASNNSSSSLCAKISETPAYIEETYILDTSTLDAFDYNYLSVLQDDKKIMSFNKGKEVKFRALRPYDIDPPNNLSIILFDSNQQEIITYSNEALSFNIETYPNEISTVDSYRIYPGIYNYYDSILVYSNGELIKTHNSLDPFELTGIDLVNTTFELYYRNTKIRDLTYKDFIYSSDYDNHIKATLKDFSDDKAPRKEDDTLFQKYTLVYIPKDSLINKIEVFYNYDNVSYLATTSTTLDGIIEFEAANRLNQTPDISLKFYDEYGFIKTVHVDDFQETGYPIACSVDATPLPMIATDTVQVKVANNIIDGDVSVSGNTLNSNISLVGTENHNGTDYNIYSIELEYNDRKTESIEIILSDNSKTLVTNTYNFKEETQPTIIVNNGGTSKDEYPIANITKEIILKIAQDVDKQISIVGPITSYTPLESKDIELNNLTYYNVYTTNITYPDDIEIPINIEIKSNSDTLGTVDFDVFTDNIIITNNGGVDKGNNYPNCDVSVARQLYIQQGLIEDIKQLNIVGSLTNYILSFSGAETIDYVNYQRYNVVYKVPTSNLNNCNLEFIIDGESVGSIVQDFLNTDDFVAINKGGLGVNEYPLVELDFNLTILVQDELAENTKKMLSGDVKDTTLSSNYVSVGKYFNHIYYGYSVPIKTYNTNLNQKEIVMTMEDYLGYVIFDSPVVYDFTVEPLPFIVYNTGIKGIGAVGINEFPTIQNANEVVYFAWTQEDGTTYYTKTLDEPTEIFIKDNGVFKAIDQVSNILVTQEGLSFEIKGKEVDVVRVESADTIINSVAYYAWMLPDGTIVFTTSLTSPDAIYLKVGSIMSLLSTATNVSTDGNNLIFDTDEDTYIAGRSDTTDFVSDDGSVVNTSVGFIFVGSPENLDIIKEHDPCFNITKDYIKTLIPDNLRETWVFERVADLLHAVISDDTPLGSKIRDYYYDVEYFSWDFTKLTLESKYSKLTDAGFGYLLDVFVTEKNEEVIHDKLNNLASYLNLLKILKGRVEGFKIILDTFGFAYSMKLWNEHKGTVNDPYGEVFTIDLTFKISNEQGQLSSDLVDKLQNIARSYLAPHVNLNYKIISEVITPAEIGEETQGHSMAVKYSGGYVNRIKIVAPHNITIKL